MKFWDILVNVSVMLALLNPPQPDHENSGLFKENIAPYLTPTGVAGSLGAFCERAGAYLSRVVLPVNNFLKDLTQIDQELELEQVKFMISSHPHTGVQLEENY